MKIAFVYMNNDWCVGRGAGYVAGAVIAQGHPLTFFDSFLEPPRKIADRVTQGGFDVLMISTVSFLFPDALELIGLVKAETGIPVLVGGVHPTILGGRLLEEHPEIDYVCVGEGESMVVEFLDRLGSPSLEEVANLAFRRDGRVVSNPPRPAEDLSTSPPFPWYLYHPYSVVSGSHGILYVNATRGCPYNCTYCCNGYYLKLYGKGYLRHRPVDQIMNELVFLKEVYQPVLFFFGDEMILFDDDSAERLFRTIKNELGYPFGIQARVEHINPRTVKMLWENGCRYVGLGVECGDEEFRRKWLNRFMSNETIIQAVDLLKKAGMFITTYNMIGYPVEDDDRLTVATIKLNQRLGPEACQVTIFAPFPGTKLYDYCLEHDLIDRDKPAKVHFHHGDTVLRGKSLVKKQEEMDRILNKLGPKELKSRLLSLLPPPSAPTWDNRPRRALLVSSDSSDPIPQSILTQAGLLAKAGRRVDVVAGFERPHEEHYFQGGIPCHRYSLDHHPSLADSLRQNQAGQGRLARLAQRFKRVRPEAGDDREQVVEGALSLYRADEVHLFDETLLAQASKLAADWEAELKRPGEAEPNAPAPGQEK